MKDLQPPLKELAQKLTPSLAFAALMVFVGIAFREQIPAPWRVVPYLLAVLGVVVNVLIEVVQARAKSQPAEVGKAEVQGSAEKSMIVTGDKNQVTLIVNEYAKTHPTDKEALQKKLDTYLEWADEIFGVVVLRGIEQGGRQVVNLPLDTVYVPLQAEYQQDELREMGTAKRGGKKLEEEMLRLEKQARKSEQIVLNEVLSLGNRLIITGGPGSGKTTVLRHIAWALAKALRGTAPMLAKEKLGLAAPLPLPVYIPLSQYAAYRRNLPPSATGHQKSLATFISDYMATRQEYLAPEPDFFAHLLQQQKDVLLLLDGLDEVPTEMEREKVSQAIEDLVAGRENLRVVVTSRIAAYRGNVVLGRGFQEVRVLPLSAEQIGNLVRQAFRSIYPGGMREAENRADKLLANIQTLEAERQQRLGDSATLLVDSPLMVRILLIVYYNERELPDQRADLYQKAVDAMLKPDYALDREVTHEIEKRVGGSLAMNRGMLQFLAFHMHQQGQAQGREISEAALRKAFEPEPTYAPYVDELIAQTRQRGTLLEEYGNQYRFLHLSFQEFLAGRHLAQNVQDVEQIASFLEDGLILDSWWREPVLLMVGYQDMIEPVQARRLLMRLAGADEEASQRPKLPYEVELAMAEIAGIAYKECKNQAEDLGERLKSRLLDRIHHPPSHIQAPMPIYLANAADALDRLGWLPEDLYQFIEIGQTANPQTDQPTHSRFAIAKYPVTNIQYQRFFGADDYADPALWKGFPKFDETSQLMEDNWMDKGWHYYQRPWPSDRNQAGKLWPSYWRDPRFGIGRLGVPVVGVSWYEANAYCQWLTKHWDKLEEGQTNLGIKPVLVRLPTVREWSLSAGGRIPENRYAWDKAGEATQNEGTILARANVAESGINRTTPVWMYPLGASPAGIMEMSGNVLEWQANRVIKALDDLVLLGGSWEANSDDAHVVYGNSPTHCNFDLGFRVLVVLPR